MAAITFSPVQGQMAGRLTNVPAFPGESFGLGIPESIGDAARAVWFGKIVPQWETLDGGSARCVARLEGELSYTIHVVPYDDCVDIALTVTNESDRDWAQSLAFNCFQCGGAPSIRDIECVRHWVRTAGEFRRLVEIPRQFGPRPTIQLYSVEGAPPGMNIPFVANFHATPPNVVLEGWIAIRSRDGGRLAATASKPALFLFQNMEYSCIHSSPGFGPLGPGDTGRALTRVYLVEATLEEWHARMLKDLA